MLIVLSKMLVITSPAIVLALLAKLFTPTTWRTLAVGCAAAIILRIVRIPIALALRNNHEVLSQLMMGEIITQEFVIIWLVSASVKYGTLWAILKYPRSKITTWHDGLVFSLGISATAAILALLSKYRNTLSRIAYESDLIPTDKAASYNEILLSLQKLPIAELAEQFNERVSWLNILWQTPQHSLFRALISLGSTLAILYCVRSGKLWLFPAAMLLNILAVPANSLGTRMWISEQARPEGAINQIAQIIFDLTFWMAGSMGSMYALYNVTNLLLIFLSAVLSLYVYKKMKAIPPVST